MAKEFADRWGVPVRAGSADAAALLDEAIEDLATLGGDPVADAEAAVGADDSLVLGHIYRAYLNLYGTTPRGGPAAPTRRRSLTRPSRTWPRWAATR